jgi:ABC-type multidrug transport system fused ATPase/permease subunit
MSDTAASLLNPNLSPSFERARTLSRVLAVLFTIGFWLAVVVALAVPLLLVWPDIGSAKWDEDLAELARYSGRERLGIVVATLIGMIPSLFLLHHARRLFGRFARGEVFEPASVIHIRAIGLWLIVEAIAGTISQDLQAVMTGEEPQAPFMITTVIFGVATYIGAYVMAEARRIADENASIL